MEVLRDPEDPMLDRVEPVSSNPNPFVGTLVTSHPNSGKSFGRSLARGKGLENRMLQNHHQK